MLWKAKANSVNLLINPTPSNHLLDNTETYLFRFVIIKMKVSPTFITRKMMKMMAQIIMYIIK